MTKRFLFAAGLVVALAGGTVVNFAQGPGGPGFGRPGRAGMHGRPDRAVLGLRGVELTEQQRDQVRSIMQSHREEFDNARKALREAHRAFGDATRAATIDESAVRTHATSVATAMADEAILRARVRAEVHALLTPEQQQQIQERQAAMQKRLQERQTQQKQREQRRQPPQ